MTLRVVKAQSKKKERFDDVEEAIFLCPIRRRRRRRRKICHRTTGKKRATSGTNTNAGMRTRDR